MITTVVFHQGGKEASGVRALHLRGSYSSASLLVLCPLRFFKQLLWALGLRHV